MIAGLPPGPRRPAALQQIAWILQPTRFLEACARRHGDPFTVRFPGYPPLVIHADPDAIRDIFAGDPAVFVTGAINAELSPILGAGSPLLLDGARHTNQRRLLLPALHGERMQRSAGVVGEIVRDSVARWPVGRPIALLPWMREITMEAILRAVLGVGAPEDRAQLRGRLARLLSLSNNLLLLVRALQVDLGRHSPWGRAVRLRDEIDAILYAEIARRRAGAAPPGARPGDGRDDVLSMLVEARDDGGAPMSERELRDVLMTLLVAGHETTSAALAWAFHHILRDPAVIAGIDAELRAVAGGGPFDPRRAAELTYLDAVVREAQRLTPVIPLIGRQLAAPARIGGREIPAGVMVFPCVYLAHRSPDRWVDPARFDPARFLRDRPGPGPCDYFPFGGGARRCLGAAFATLQMKVVIAEVLARVALRPAPGPPSRMARRALLLAPHDGVRVIVEDRRDRGAVR